MALQNEVLIMFYFIISCGLWVYVFFVKAIKIDYHKKSNSR